ncbi:UNVERIFIED_CONTAM: hypothetical protein Slati_0841900 [Sesamum latifolium]|uniref:Uncharacterized protein n=1 Tax=Sesamum latifolium TaxID=2727402 RepID=A0AAW2XQ11_9LAMI
MPADTQVRKRPSNTDSYRLGIAKLFVWKLAGCVGMLSTKYDIISRMFGHGDIRATIRPPCAWAGDKCVKQSALSLEICKTVSIASMLGVGNTSKKFQS